MSTHDAWTDLAEGRWQRAREAFEALLRAAPTPESFEGLSWAAWWLDDAETVFTSRETAFDLYRARGDLANAARMATWIAADSLDFRGASTVARGWLRRAHRLLDGIEPGPDHGWLAFHEGYIASGRGDAERALVLAGRAAELGRRFDVPDLEMLGLALEGVVRVSGADVEQGMACLDEAAATALEGGSAIPISRAWACCFLVGACETVRDYERAFEWCDRIAEFAARYGSRYMLAFCRAHYGEVHLWRGQWQEAQAQLEAAVEDYAQSRPAYVGGVIARLAELRRRQGRWDDAQRLLAGMGGQSAQLCSARLALDRGDLLRAAELAERCLRQLPARQPLAGVAAYEILIRARSGRGQIEQAEAALEELRRLERAAGTLALRASVRLGEGLVHAARNEHDRARTCHEDAADLFERSRTPYEAAIARLELATSLAALDRPDAAEREARIALEALTELGATAEARRANHLLAEPQHDTRISSVTRRERDVLSLLCEGLTNRQIADRLTVSEHTVHRHITNILRKLELPSRAAAAAWAVRAGIGSAHQ